MNNQLLPLDLFYVEPMILWGVMNSLIIAKSQVDEASMRVQENDPFDLHGSAMTACR